MPPEEKHKLSAEDELLETAARKEQREEGLHEEELKLSAEDELLATAA
jgi:hypothetical protein